MNYSATDFDKWAAICISTDVDIPDTFERLVVPSGDFVVIPFVGKASDAPPVFQYIYGTWIPQSPYELDDRPHLAIMPPGYNPEDPLAREEFWIPVKTG